MLGFIKKDRQNSALTERVRGWTRQRFGLDDDETVMVSEIACQVPGCPPIETHVVFWTAAGRHHFKIFKPLAAVSEDDLLLLADAQTSGGLLVAGELPGAPVIGELVPRRDSVLIIR